MAVAASSGFDSEILKLVKIGPKFRKDPRIQKHELGACWDIFASPQRPVRSDGLPVSFLKTYIVSNSRQNEEEEVREG